MPIDLMLCFARTGGTLLNQILGSLPNVVILSEVNPLGGGWGREGIASLTTPRAQALGWYGIELKTSDFGQSLKELSRVCKSQFRRLIVRDWSFVNFMPYENNDYNPPLRLLTLLEIKKHCSVRPFALVRDAVDIWLSRNIEPADIFFYYYLKYVRAIKSLNCRIFKYEDLCEDPESFVKDLCQYLKIDFSERYKDFAAFHTVNGDVQRPDDERLRFREMGEISRKPRKVLGGKTIQYLNSISSFAEANQLLGYPILE